MGSGDQSGRVAQTQRFQVIPSARILADDRTRFLSPNETEVGWIVRTGHVPLGYLDDEGATNATFPVAEGQRSRSLADRAQYTDNGEVVLLGRDSLVVNTGGEKVFVEEVEDVLKRHDAVVDVLVTGRPDNRFGQAVVAVVQLTSPDAASPGDLRAWCGDHLARYKAPRAVVFVDEVRRHPSGKADYRWAKERAAKRSTPSAEHARRPAGRMGAMDGNLLVRGGDLVDGTGRRPAGPTCGCATGGSRRWAADLRTRRRARRRRRGAPRGARSDRVAHALRRRRVVGSRLRPDARARLHHDGDGQLRPRPGAPAGRTTGTTSSTCSRSSRTSRPRPSDLAVPWTWETWAEYRDRRGPAPAGRQLRRVPAPPAAAHLGDGRRRRGTGRHRPRARQLCAVLDDALTRRRARPVDLGDGHRPGQPARAQPPGRRRRARRRSSPCSPGTAPCSSTSPASSSPSTSSPTSSGSPGCTRPRGVPLLFAGYRLEEAATDGPRRARGVPRAVPVVAGAPLWVNFSARPVAREHALRALDHVERRPRLARRS